ncbi:Tubulin-tyrosine ligase/Tubulin polyglutamylase [Balamuthia mandrillaris]
MSAAENKQLTAVVDTACSYVQQLWLQLLQEEGWTIKTPSRSREGEEGEESANVYSDVDFLWTDYFGVPWSLVHQDGSKRRKRLCTNWLPRANGIAEKAQLLHHSEKYGLCHPKSALASAIPKSVALTLPSCGNAYKNDKEQMKQVLKALIESKVQTLEANQDDNASSKDGPSEYGCSRPRWILKASDSRSAQQVYLCSSVEDACDALLPLLYDDDEDKNEEPKEEQRWKEWVLQQYIDPPLVVDGGRKFHLRAHVLVTGREEMKVYFFDDGVMAFLASESYVKEAKKEKGLEEGCREEEERERRFAHITNNAVNKWHHEWSEKRGTMLFEEVFESLAEEKIAELRRKGEEAEDEEANRIKEEMKDKMEMVRSSMHAIAKEVFEAVHGQPTAFMPMDTCFELFGFDFLVDAQWKTWLLEVNAGPDLAAYGARLRPLCTRFLRECYHVAVCPVVLGLLPSSSEPLRPLAHLVTLRAGHCVGKQKQREGEQVTTITALLEVKPWDSDTQASQLEAMVRSVAIDEAEENEAEEEEESKGERKGKVVWANSKAVPIGYGIEKLQIVAITVNVEPETLAQLIAEQYEDSIQSVDVVSQKVELL